ncbi:MAG TPA: guanylate kinase [Candidatus Dormibacteraeota bacterium]|nr:guanylate kinase [Candidatus Dormibacteraeota bacterium]
MSSADVPRRRGLLVVLSGPSGVGKDSVLKRVFELDPSLSYSVSYTTRQPRPGEEDGVDYTFVSDEDFDRLVDGGQLLEWANVHGHRSGTGRARVEAALESGRDIALNIDVQGGEQIHQLVPGALRIFLAPPSMEELARRRSERATEDAADLARRASDAEMEMGYSDRYDVVVVNDDIDRAASQILDVINRRRGTQQ